MRKLFLLLFVIVLTNSMQAQNENEITATDGTLTFTAKTVSNGATYSPKNVLAIWIKDASGNFVISRKVMANARKQHLVKWMASSGNNSVDATTGATLSNHQTHTVTWDCRDLNGNLVPDGDYQVWIEYTSRNSANGGSPGPSYSITFTKGTETFNPTIPDEAYFINMTLLYEPSSVGISDANEANRFFTLMPNPAVNECTVTLNLSEGSYSNVSVYDLNGRRVLEAFDGYITDNKQNIIITNDSHQLVPGTYIVRLNTGTKIFSQKLLIQE